MFIDFIEDNKKVIISYEFPYNDNKKIILINVIQNAKYQHVQTVSSI